jgi:hypothetical protein
MTDANHAPSDLRKAFHEWLDAGRPEKVSINGTTHSSKWLLDEVQFSDDFDKPVPPEYCEKLGLPIDSTYENAVDSLNEKAKQVTPEMLAESAFPDDGR